MENGTPVTVDETQEFLPNWAYFPQIEKLRFILMLLLCINLFGLPTIAGNYIEFACNFVPAAFFILSGFLVLRQDENRSKIIVRTILRALIAFVLLALFYYAINLLYYRFFHIDMIPAFSQKRYWFHFLVMNIWQFDVGSTIWYIQALLYAYIVIYFLNKFNLLKYDLLIAGILLTVAALTGEFSSVFNFNLLGLTYIPGNFFTRALPYILIGGFINRKLEYFDKIPRVLYLAGFFVGIGLNFAELYLLSILRINGYTGHLITTSVAAVSICMFTFGGCLINPNLADKPRIIRWFTNTVYYFMQPVGVLVAALAIYVNNGFFRKYYEYVGIFAFAFSCAAALFFFLIIKLITDFIRENRKLNEI